MDALISGRAGTALLLDGNLLVSITVGDPGNLVPRQLEEVQFLFSETTDLEILENVDSDQVVQELEFAYKFTCTLDLALIALDPEISIEVREESVSTLEFLLNDARILKRIESILYARTLPSTADLAGVLECCTKNNAVTVYTLLENLRKHQPSIQEVCLAWELIPSNLFSSDEQRAELQKIFIKEGLFRKLAILHQDKTDISLSTINPSSSIQLIPFSLEVLRHWIMLLQRYDEIGDEDKALGVDNAHHGLISAPHRELVIVGGGILGLMTAHAAYERGFRDITLFELPGPLNLNADTLRNHAWLQSGMLYAETNKAAASRMWKWGSQMLREFGLPIPEQKSVLGFPNDRNLKEAFYKRAEFLQTSERVKRLSEKEASEVLGPFFNSDYIYYRIPDAHFNEARLLITARQRAKDLNIHLWQSAVELVRSKESDAGYVIRVDGREIKSRYIVLCEGAGLLDLLKQLELEHPLALFRSVSLRITPGNVMRTPLFVDISENLPTSGLTVVQHSPEEVPPRGCLVISSSARVRLKRDQIKERIVTSEEDAVLQKLLPPELLPARHNVSVEVRHEVQACDKDGRPLVDPWIGLWPQYPQLIAAVPGRATQALYVAEQIMNRLTLPPPDEESNDMPRLHHLQALISKLDEEKK